MTATDAFAELMDDNTVVEMVADVFTGLFGEGRGVPHPDVTAGPLPVGACVGVTGAWQGQIDVACSAELAHLAAAELFDVAVDAVSDADVRDVVGELANVVGGNVKSALPGPSVLSLPSTRTPASVPAVRVESDGVSPALVLDLTWSGQPIRVSIWTMPTPPPSQPSSKGEIS